MKTIMETLYFETRPYGQPMLNMVSGALEPPKPVLNTVSGALEPPKPVLNTVSGALEPQKPVLNTVSGALESMKTIRKTLYFETRPLAPASLEAEAYENH